MPEQAFAQVMSTINGKAFEPSQLSTVYLIVGGDDSLKRELTRKLLEIALDPGFSDFDSETIDLGPGFDAPDGEADPSLRIQSAAALAPFMSPRRVVTVASVQRLPKERQTSLAEGLKSLGAASLLLLVADAPEWEGGRPKGRQIEAALKKSAATIGTVVNCEAPQGAGLRSRAADLFKEWGVAVDGPVLDTLAEYAATVSANGGSGAVASLTRECEKLRSYSSGKAKVTMTDVDALLPRVAQENIFRLLDAIGARNARAALEQVDALLNAGEKPDGVVARTLVMLQRHIRLLMLGKFAAERKLGARGATVPEDVKEILSAELVSTLTGQAYRLPTYSKQATNFSWDELVWATTRILASDMSMKGMTQSLSIGAVSPVPGDDAAANLRVLVAQLCAGIK